VAGIGGVTRQPQQRATSQNIGQRLCGAVSEIAATDPSDTVALLTGGPAFSLKVQLIGTEGNEENEDRTT
jgi:hypothetical protein